MNIKQALNIDKRTHVRQFTCGIPIPYLSQKIADYKIGLISAVFKDSEIQGNDLEFENRRLINSHVLRQQLCINLITILREAHKDSKEYKQALEDYKGMFYADYVFPNGIDTLINKIKQHDQKIAMMRPQENASNDGVKYTFFFWVSWVESILNIKPHIDRKMKLWEFKEYYNLAVETMKNQQANGTN